MRLASFDIFDTTLLRRCGRPEAVWNALAENLFPEEIDLQEAFVVWRKNAQGGNAGGKICWYRFLFSLFLRNRQERDDASRRGC